MLLPLKAQERVLLDHKAELCRPTAAPLVAAPGGGGGRDIEREIRVLEEQLKALSANDPRRTQLQRDLEELKRLRDARPVGATLAQGLPQALASIDARLRRNARAHDAFLRSPEAKNLQMAEVAAITAIAEGRLEGALAALTAAVTLDSNNPSRLVNLSGVLDQLGMANEALLVLQAADALGGARGSVGGVPFQALALNNRGAALLALGRWKDAEGPLTQALKLAPQLAEANTNLSRAQLCQGRTSEAARTFQAGMRRTPNSQSPRDLPVDFDFTKTGEGGGDDSSSLSLRSAEESRVRRPASALFDLSQGQDWTLPPLKFPAVPEDVVPLLPQYRALQERWEELEAADIATDRNTTLDLSGLGVERQTRAVWNAIATSDTDPDILPLRQAYARVQLQFNNRRAEASRTLSEDRSRILDKGYEDECQLIAANRAVELKYLDSVRSSYKGLEMAVAAYGRASVRRQTALAANLPTRQLRAHELAFIQHAKQALFYGTMLESAIAVADEIWAQFYEKPCVPPSKAALDPVKFEAFSIADCPPGLNGKALSLSKKVTMSADAQNVLQAGGGSGGDAPKHVFDFKVSCAGLELKAKSSEAIGLFASLKDDMRGTTTLVFGIAGQAKVPGLSNVGAKLGAEGTEGVYLRWGRDGLEDVGLRITLSGEASAGALGSQLKLPEFKEGFEVEFGVAAAVEYWTSDAYDENPDDE